MNKFAAGAQPWTRTPLFWGWIAMAIPFGGIAALTVADAFADSPAHGWSLLVGGSLLIAGIYVIGFAFARLPVFRLAYRVRRENPNHLVLIGQRDVTTAEALSRAVGRLALANSRDDAFVLRLSVDGVEFYSIVDPLSPVRLDRILISSIEIERKQLFVGRSSVIVLGGADVSFAILDARKLFNGTIRGKRLERLAYDLRAALLH